MEGEQGRDARYGQQRVSEPPEELIQSYSDLDDDFADCFKEGREERFRIIRSLN